MSDFDDTDELPSTSEVFRVPDDQDVDPPAPAAESASADEVPSAGSPEPTPRDVDSADAAATTPLPSEEVVRDQLDTTSEDANGHVDEPGPVGGPVGRPARFAPARRRALLWNAGWYLVAGVVLLVLASVGRPVESGPDWVTVVAGAVGVGWAAVLAAMAAGGVSRATTALAGLLNLVVGGGAFALGWAAAETPTLLLVLAAQGAGFGLVQLVASVRR